MSLAMHLFIEEVQSSGIHFMSPSAPHGNIGNEPFTMPIQLELCTIMVMHA